MTRKIITSSRAYYHQYDIWFQDGNYKRAPEPLAESVKDFVQSNQFPWYAIGESGETQFLDLAREHNVTPRRILAGAFDPKRVDAFAFYLLGGVDNVFGFVDPKFDTEHLLFDRQIECSRELHADCTASAWGCGNGKRQIRKICVFNPSKVGKRDFFNPALWAYCNQRILVVTRRVRDALIAANLTGFELRPVLDGKKKWSARELEYDHIDEAQERDAQWFQLTITGRNATPVPLAQPLLVPVRQGEQPIIAEACSICHFSYGSDLSPYKMDQKIHPLSRFANVDIQVWDWFRFSGKDIIADGLTAGLVVSSRFIEMIEQHKFKGITRGPKKFPYHAMLIKEEIEATLGRDQVRQYPIAE